MHITLGKLHTTGRARSGPLERPGGTVVGVSLIALFAGAGEALAHDAPLDRRVGWQDWNWDPVILLNLTILGWLYARGWSTLRERRGVGQSLSPYRAAAFTAGMLSLVVALVSPLDPLSEQLAWAHMVQHMTLMTVAAPLLIAGAPSLVCLCGLSRGARRFASRMRRGAGRFGSQWLWNPLLVWAVYALAMWIWHVPALYGAALRNPFVHDLQHLTFFLAACLFWRLLLDPLSRFRLGGGLAVLFLFTTTLHATVLGVFMTLAPSPWYAEYLGRTELWGLTALEDQQLAGLIMWMPACAAYAVVAIALFAQALEERPEKPARTLFEGTVVQ